MLKQSITQGVSEILWGGIRPHSKTGSVPGWEREPATATNASNLHGGGYRKTSDQKRAELNGQPRPDGNNTGHADGTKCYTESAITLWGGYNRGTVPAEISSDEPPQTVRTGKTDWTGWRRNTIAGVGDFTADKTSIFNKQKWLPLCRDGQFMISHMCCSVMKKAPMKNYQKKSHLYPIIGTLTEESKLREQAWIKHGCNAFDATYKTSQPMSFWTEQDVLKYLYMEGYEIASVYGEIVGVDDMGFEYEPLPGVDCRLKCTGCQRTGCIFCGFGCHLEKGETRFQRLAKTHPKQYEYCMGGGQWVDNPKYDPAAPKMDGDWVNWNPKKIWVPSKEGLGMKHVFDECNQIYGKDFIRYE